MAGSNPAHSRISLFDAFMMGYRWRQCLVGSNVEDSRAVGRTLGSDALAGLQIDLRGFNSFMSGDDGIVEALARIERAMSRSAAGRALTESEVQVVARIRAYIDGKNKGLMLSDVRIAVETIESLSDPGCDTSVRAAHDAEEANK